MESPQIELDGWLERQGFSPVLMGSVVLLGVFLFFQVLGAVLGALLLLGQGMSLQDAGQMIAPAMVPALMWANALGQVVGMALPVLLITRAHTRQVGAFLRLRRPEGRALGLAALGLVVWMPFLQWITTVNMHLPLPEGLRAFDLMQQQLIRQFLEGLSGADWLLALVALAVVPAFCEELLFRGYVQRQYERGMGAPGAILAVGVLFGMFHLRFTQVIPLALIGLYLAYITWATDSLWPAVLVHFLNNGFAVLTAFYVQQHPSLTLEQIEALPVPWYAALPSLVVGTLFLRYFHTHVRRRHP